MRGAVPAGLTRWAACAVLLLSLFAPQLAEAQAPDTVVPILNRAELRYRTTAGAGGTVTARHLLHLRLHPRLALSPGTSIGLCGGESHIFKHVLTNEGNGPDAVTLEAFYAEGVTGTLRRGTRSDGEPSESDPELDGPITLARGDSVVVFVHVETDPELEDVSLEVGLRAQSSIHPDAFAEVTDTLDVCGPAPSLTVTLGADLEVVQLGDTLGYTVEIENEGGSSSFSSVLVDSLPPTARLLAGTVTRGGSSLDPDAGEYTLETLEDERQVLRVPLDTIESGASTTVSFRTVVVTDSSVTEIENVVFAHERDQVSRSNSVGVEARFPTVALETRVRGRSLIFVGDEVTFELEYTNTSNAYAMNAVIDNVLPEEMTLLRVSSDPPDAIQKWEEILSAPALDGVSGVEIDDGDAARPAVRLELGTLEPGASGTILLHTRLEEAPRDESGELRNHTRLSAGPDDHAVVITRAVAPVVVGAEGAELVLRKTAGQLEVGLGEAVPYLLEVENTGTLPLHNPVIEGELPDGLELIDDAIIGADSVQVDGRSVVFRLTGALVPGAVDTVRYAAVATAADGEAVGSRAVALAEDRRVTSDTATAWVRVRRGPSLPARTLIGKVWVDHDGDGIQRDGDEGLGGADIWTSDGQVVRTDDDGRFSLQDLEPGRYTLRLDMLGLDDEYELAEPGGDLQEIRMDGWTMGRADFRLVPRRVIVDNHAGPPLELLAAPDDEDDASNDGGDASNGGANGGPIVVEPARSTEDREGARRRNLTAGPGVEFTAPDDGSVVTAGRIYVGVRGEAGRPVELLDTVGVRREGTIRPDGIFDFVAVELEPGPNHFRVRMTNSWGTERWDSVVVHRSGRPDRFELEHAPDHLRAESPVVDTLRARVLDAWGVPVTGGPLITVETEGMSVEAPDEDRSSVGHQLRPDSTGWLVVPVRAGHVAVPGQITLRSADAELVVPVRVLTSARPLIATMSGRLGFGGAEDGSHASITARGAIDELTSFTLSYDTRRGDDEMATFGRGYDPLDEALYPTTGDFSQRRVLSGSTDAFSARIERGLDWLAFGDVRTEGFSSGQLTSYDRSFSGVSSRIATGPIVWHGFGSATKQQLEELQIRGGDGSGPYSLGPGVRPGTEILTIETRARDNAARVIARRPLTRYVDYQIDYGSGDVLLNRLLPATDGHGNPIFLIASLERLDADDRHWVGGLRMELDAVEAFDIEGADSLGISLFGIRDGGDATPTSPDVIRSGLLGGEAEARFGASSVGLELLHANADSSALAGRASAEWSIADDRARLRGDWMKIGDGFSSRQRTRLHSGLEEFRFGGDLEITDGLRLYLDTDRQAFRAHDVDRRSHRARLEHARGERLYSLEGGLVSESRNSVTSSEALLTRFNAALSPDITLWAENRHALKESETRHGASQLAGGLSVRFLERLRAEAQYRRIRTESPYSLASLMLSADSWKGGELWGGVESTDGERRENGLAFGWSQRLQLPAGWSVNSQLERRFRLDDLDIADPVRALPFPQLERDRFNASLGAQWRSRDADHAFSIRGEYNDGDLASGYRFESQGDVSLADGLSILTRHDWLRSERSRGTGRDIDRREHSLLGLAFRPSRSNTVNALAKVEWRRTVRPGTYGDPIFAGDNARLIGAADLVWSPVREAEATFRYALRNSTVSGQAFGDLELSSFSHFFGMSAEHDLYRRLSGRLDSRLLHTTTADESRWSLAPTLIVDLDEFEIEAGYRFGNLRDIDFAGRGGLGFFASIGVRLTERSAANIAEFWRYR